MNSLRSHHRGRTAGDGRRHRPRDRRRRRCGRRRRALEARPCRRGYATTDGRSWAPQRAARSRSCRSAASALRAGRLVDGVGGERGPRGRRRPALRGSAADLVAVRRRVTRSVGLSPVARGGAGGRGGRLQPDPARDDRRGAGRCRSSASSTQAGVDRGDDRPRGSSSVRGRCFGSTNSLALRFGSPLRSSDQTSTRRPRRPARATHETGGVRQPSRARPERRLRRGGRPAGPGRRRAGRQVGRHSAMPGPAGRHRQLADLRRGGGRGDGGDAEQRDDGGERQPAGQVGPSTSRRSAVIRSRRVPSHGENLVQHSWREPAGKGVLLADVVTTEQRGAPPAPPPRAPWPNGGLRCRCAHRRRRAARARTRPRRRRPARRRPAGRGGGGRARGAARARRCRARPGSACCPAARTGRRRRSGCRSARGRRRGRRWSAGWRGRPGTCAANSTSPDRSPVKMRPVRLPPCAAGARPRMPIRASAGPKPGTGRPQYSWSRKAARLVAATSSRHATSRGHSPAAGDLGVEDGRGLGCGHAPKASGTGSRRAAT